VLFRSIRKVKVVDADGSEWVVVRRKGLSKANKVKVALMDNRSAEVAEWDTDVLAEIYEDNPEYLDKLFFDDELGELLGFDPGEPGELEGEDEAPEVPAEPITKPGDVYLLGEHRLLCGDATSQQDVQTLMAGKNAEFCFTSPPYLDVRDYGGADLSVEKLKKFISVASIYCDFFAVNLGIIRKDGNVVRYWDEYIKEAESVELKLSSWNIWSKSKMGGSIGNMTAMFPIEHEWILIFGGNKERVKRTKPNKTAGLHTGISNRQKDGTTQKVSPKMVKEFGRIGSVYESCYQTGEKDHPAVFPVAFPEEYIKACSNEADNIYEPFAGSGSTLIACEKLSRKCYMMEIDPGYCDVIVNRYKDLFPDQPVTMETER
jgi:DNA modification methylase